MELTDKQQHDAVSHLAWVLIVLTIMVVSVAAVVTYDYLKTELRITK